MIYVTIEEVVYNLDELGETEQAKQHMRNAGIAQTEVYYTPNTLEDVVENGDFDGYPNGMILIAA